MAKKSASGLSQKQKLQIVKIITHIGALLPLILLYIDYYTYNLGSDEIRAAILRTGKPALILLILSLACTPLNYAFGWKLLLPLRKPLGLYGFLYVVVHLAIFVGIDYGSDIVLAWEEIVRRRYALVGFASFLILIPLAATSTKWAMRKLGKRWKTLHRTAYLAAILGAVHYLWLIKQNYTEPLIYAAILAIFLVMRYEPIKKKTIELRKSVKKRFA